MHPSRILVAAALSALASSALAQQQGRPGRQGGNPPTAEQFVERMMSNDANGDGKLSRDELPGPFAERMFESGDANGDGFLDSSELKAAAEAFMAQRGNRPGRPDRAGAPGEGRPGDAIDRPGAARPGEAGVPRALNFHRGMEQAGRAMRSLRRSSFNAASLEADLENIGLFQEGMMAAKLDMMSVRKAKAAEDRFGEDDAKYMKEFRMTLAQTLMESLVLEMAVVDGDSEAAKTSVGHLVQIQKEGHDLFQADEDEAEAESPSQRRPGNRSPASPRRPADEI